MESQKNEDEDCPDVKNELAEDEFEADDYKPGIDAVIELKKTILEPPQVSFSENMSDTNIMKGYKSADDLFNDINKLEKFGTVDAVTGEYDFGICKHCDGPKLGHKDREEVCRQKVEKAEIEKYKDEEVGEIKTWLKSIHKDFFNVK